mmetsp:Transcript_5763/g.15026  ORF Transcript_5763/g.15026 Transcript_5763/m.15026 type:complete len:83 (+) Transcript_5763:535-783(+)
MFSGQRHLRFLRRLHKQCHRSRIATNSRSGALSVRRRNFAKQHARNTLVKIVAAQLRVASGAQHLEDTVAACEQRNVARAAT